MRFIKRTLFESTRLQGHFWIVGFIMQFTIGSAVFLSSLLLLAILSRVAAASPDPAILRGEFAPAMLSVLVTSGLTIGLLLMVMGGSGYFESPTLELASIFGFAIASIWIIVKLVGRAPRSSEF